MNKTKRTLERIGSIIAIILGALLVFSGLICAVSTDLVKQLLVQQGMTSQEFALIEGILTQSTALRKAFGKDRCAVLNKRRASYGSFITSRIEIARFNRQTKNERAANASRDCPAIRGTSTPYKTRHTNRDCWLINQLAAYCGCIYAIWRHRSAAIRRRSTLPGRANPRMEKGNL